MRVLVEGRECLEEEPKSGGRALADQALAEPLELEALVQNLSDYFQKYEVSKKLPTEVFGGDSEEPIACRSDCLPPYNWLLSDKNFRADRQW